MKSFTAVALSAVALFASVSPAIAGGPWDGAYAQPGPPPAPYGYGPASCECAPPPPPCDCAPVRYEEDVALPTEFFDGAGGVGPEAYMFDTGGGGGGEIVENAGASASASASASVSVSVRDIIRQHQRMAHYTKPSCGCSSGKKW